MKEVCGACRYNRYCGSEFCCGNEDSDNYGAPTFYDDSCEEWEEKE